MEHEALLVLSLDDVHDLHVARGAERGGAKRLRLSALEHDRAVKARERLHHDLDRADFLEAAAVGTLLRVERERAALGVEDVLDDLADPLGAVEIGRIGQRPVDDHVLGVDGPLACIAPRPQVGRAVEGADPGTGLLRVGDRRLGAPS